MSFYYFRANIENMLKPVTFLLSLVSFIIVLSLFISSCKKDAATNPTTVNACVADSGGAKTIITLLEHHGVNIPNQISQPDTVWVKFNADNWSNAPIGYKLRFIGVGGYGQINLTNLTCGTYFLYGCGLDTSISSNVYGGLRVVLAATDSIVLKAIPVVE